MGYQNVSQNRKVVLIAEGIAEPPQPLPKAGELFG
jgi:hypothetical protein